MVSRTHQQFWTIELVTLSSLALLLLGLSQKTYWTQLSRRSTTLVVRDTVDLDNDLVGNTSHPFTKRDVGHNFGVPLRVLPVGDSITEGWESSDQNGYRLRLHQLLASDGNPVDFIGAISEGQNNPDNQHEGYGGRTITQIQGYVQSDRILLQNPNIILLMAGTNDIWHPPDSDPRDQAPARLAAFIDQMLCQNGDAVLFVAAILQMNVGADIEAYNEAFVAAIPAIVQDRYKRGYKIRMVNFFDIMTTDDLRDGIHPTDAGYLKMADVWYSAINNVPTEWVTKPRDPIVAGAAGTREQCARDSLSWVSADYGGYVALGAHDPGDSGTGSDAEPLWAAYFPAKDNYPDLGNDGAGLLFYADMDGDGRADRVMYDGPTDELTITLNTDGTGGSRRLAGPSKVGFGQSKGINLIDMNGDGRADFVFVDDGTTGTASGIYVWLNTGLSGDVVQFSRDAQQISPQPSVNTPSNILFGDVNGDGLMDVLIMRLDQGDGKIDGYIQQGSLGNWQVCEGLVYNDDPHLLLADLDGDGRDDFLSIDDNGGESGYLNVVGSGVCGISWSPLGGKDAVAAGAGSRALLHMADWNGDGKADYLVANFDNSLDVWINYGFSTNVTQMTGVGAGVRLADLNADGLDDYIAVGPDSSAIGFYNGGENGQGAWIWPYMNNNEKIAYGSSNAKRHQIHFADVNGDGLQDYLCVDDATGSVLGYFNNGQQSAGWSWLEQGKIAEGVPDRGDSPGEGVRFGDLDGDGRADYLWLDENGKLLGFLNVGKPGDSPQWYPVYNFNFIALGVGAKRSEVQFADIDGDGRVDYLWVHPLDGSVDVWWNDGPASDGGWVWTPGGRIADGVGYPGLNIIFGRIGVSGRADYVAVEALDGALKLWLSGCHNVIKTTTGSSIPNSGNCLGPPNEEVDADDGDAPVLLIPPPIGGESIPGPGEGNSNGSPNIHPTGNIPGTTGGGGNPQKPIIPPLIRWAGLGDSFAAGPGAGSKILDGDITDPNCLQSNGSYVAQLQQRLVRFNTLYQHLFLACTGAVTRDVMFVQWKQIMDRSWTSQFYTLSIGGNDVGFADILKACLLTGLTSCDDAIARSRKIMDEQLEKRLINTWDIIALRLNGITPFILQQSYPSFFVSTTTWCSNKKMGLLPGVSPTLTQERRGQLNDLAQHMQQTLKNIAQTFNSRNQEQGRNRPDRVVIMDDDDTSVYPTHRFCEEGVKNFDDVSQWIFTWLGKDVTPGDKQVPLSAEGDETISSADVLGTWDASNCAQDPRYDTWSEYSIGCEYALYLATSEGQGSKVDTFIVPEGVMRAFHPKSVAMDAIAENHVNFIRANIAPPAISVGDGGVVQCRPYADYGVNSQTYSTYDDVGQAIVDFCTGSMGDPAVTNGAYAFFGDMVVQVTTNYNTEPDCPTLDSSDKGWYNLCVSSFQNTLDNCDNDPPPNMPTLKQGGYYYYKCATFSVQKCVTEPLIGGKTLAGCEIPVFPALQREA